MKLKYSFEKVDMDNEIIYVPVGDGATNIHGVLRMNKAGEKILDLLKDEITEEKIVDNLELHYDNSKQNLAEYVHKTIETLYEASLLDE